jgi:hypothetical protein
MIQRTLFLAAACFFCFSAFSNAQETSYTYDGTLTQDDIDQSILYGSPDDISRMDEDKVYMDQIIVPNDYQATTGCLLVQERTWNGTTGGQCANGIDGTYTFGYGQTVIAQTQDAIAEALKVAGITVVGYRWQWKVKNADTNYEDTNGARGQDPLIVTVTVKDKQGNVLDEREWDYSYHIDNWQQKYGMHWYDPFISGDKIDTITLEVEAYDAGYWAGYYGPEFGSAAIYSILVVEPPETQDCSDPLLDPTCPGYAEALNAQQDDMLALINNSTTAETSTGNDDVAFVAEVTAVVEESVNLVSEGVSESIAVEASAEPIQKEIVEEIEQVVEVAETTSTESSTEESANSPSVDPLAVAQNAVSAALSEAASNVSNTLEATSQSVADAEAVFESNEQQLQQLSQTQSAETQLLSDNIQEANQAQLTEQASIESSFQQNIESNIAAMQNEQQNLSMTQQQASSAQDGNQTTSSSASSIDNTGNVDSVQFTTQQSNISTVLGAFENNDTFNPDITDNQISVEVVVDSFEVAALNMVIDEVFQAALNRNFLLNTEEKEEEEQKSFEEQNAEEDTLVAAAQSGDDSEDAQAALLGYNPNFRAYQQPQIPDTDFYKPKEIYEGNKNYDNPNGRLFNGASDTLHREMVRQQYERN